MKLQVHLLKPAHGAKHKVKRIGRGNASGHGTYATRGGKGQTARSGGSRGIQRRAFKFQMQSTPKLRGFHSQYARDAEVYLSDLESKYAEGETVDLKSLKAKALVGVNAKVVKILNKGVLNKKLTVVGIATTKVAAEKIKAVGGEVK
ncbi:MAG: 50S ribosomal protein L15 [bacterium]|nr:50S ribosomal protein L15 [bacterium]